jgi:hypothetical protein
MLKRSELYNNAYQRKLEKVVQLQQVPEGTELMSLVLLGVKSFIRTGRKKKNLDYEDLVQQFEEMEFIKILMSTMTPKEFLTTFPIDKKYDGKRYEIKDYFYTMEMIKTMNTDERIGTKIDNFLWDYQNLELCLFQIELLGVMDDIARLKGKPTMMDVMSAEWGIPFYKMNEENQTMSGPYYVKKIDGDYYQDTSKVKIKRVSKPRHLKLIKKG